MKLLADKSASIDLDCANARANLEELWIDVNWEDVERDYLELLSTPLSSDNLEDWLKSWEGISGGLDGAATILGLARDENCEQIDRQERYDKFQSEINLRAEPYENRLTLKLLESGLTIPGGEIPFQRLRYEISNYHPETTEARIAESGVVSEYVALSSDQRLSFNHKETTVDELSAKLSEMPKEERKRAWRALRDHFLSKSDTIDSVWAKLLEIRYKIAQITRGAVPTVKNYRDIAWSELGRIDYSPDDVVSFCDAIKKVITPIATDIYIRAARSRGAETLRPWDLRNNDSSGIISAKIESDVRPYKELYEFRNGTRQLLNLLNPDLATSLDLLASTNLSYPELNEKSLINIGSPGVRAPYQYSDTLALRRLPLIFQTAIGSQDDINTFFHEFGHAYHSLQSRELPFSILRETPLEFCEVASTSLEFAHLEILRTSRGGIYSDDVTREIEIRALTDVVLFLPYMAVVSLFQNWVYSREQSPPSIKDCDQMWGTLWSNFIPGVDFSGEESYRDKGWQRKSHIFANPFYYVEYGLAYLGALQFRSRYRVQPKEAFTTYSEALKLGGTRNIPQLFEAAGLEFGMSEEILLRIFDPIRKELGCISE